MQMFNTIPTDRIDAGTAMSIKRQIAEASNQDQLTDALISIPIGLGADPESPEALTTRELRAKGMSGLQILRAQARANRAPQAEPTALDIREQEARIRKLEADASQAKGVGGFKSFEEKKNFQRNAMKFVEDTPEGKHYYGALTGYRNIANGFARQDGVGDNSILVGMAHLTDPGSTARIGEVELARNAQSIFEQVKATLAGWRVGDQLSPEVRKRYYSFARELMMDYSNGFRRDVTDSPRIKKLLEDTGLAPEDIAITPLTEEEMASSLRERQERIGTARAAGTEPPAQVTPEATKSSLEGASTDQLRQMWIQGGGDPAEFDRMQKGAR
jgi:hypothetical protein